MCERERKRERERERATTSCIKGSRVKVEKERKGRFGQETGRSDGGLKEKCGKVVVSAAPDWAGIRQKCSEEQREGHKISKSE